MTHAIIIGDYHAHPDYSNDRAELLGRFCGTVRPDVIVQMGDWVDFPSLCKHSSRLDKEGRRAKEDAAAGEDALDRFERSMFAAARPHQDAQRASKKAIWQPRKVLLKGNHDARTESLYEEHPQLEGAFDQAFSLFELHNWEIFPFKEVFTLAGWSMSHFVPSGTMGRPAGGKYPARAVLDSAQVSTIVGHDHRFDYSSKTRVDKTKVHAIVAGCFVHPDYIEGWCRQTRQMWDLGVLELKGMSNGDYESMRWVKMAELERR